MNIFILMHSKIAFRYLYLYIFSHYIHTYLIYIYMAYL